jgi:hypothetical protein
MISIETLDLDTFNKDILTVGWEILNSLKKDISTVEKVSTVWKTISWQGLCPKIWTFYNVSIETLNLDSFNMDISTIEKFSTLWKKAISTCRDISISIALDSRDPQA